MLFRRKCLCVGYFSLRIAAVRQAFVAIGAGSILTVIIKMTYTIIMIEIVMVMIKYFSTEVLI